MLLSGTRNVVGLASGGSSTGSRTVTIPASLSQGTYRLLACADDLAKVPETNEANNCVASASSVVIGLPDLRVTHVSNPPAALRPGRTFSVTDTVQNGGTAPAGASTARYYLSANATKDSGDVLLSPTRSIAILAPGAASTGSKTVTIPTTSPLGMFYLIACADDRVAVRESNETNNCTAK